MFRPQRVPRDSLVDVLWADSPPDAAGTALNALISKVRAAVGPEVLRGRDVGGSDVVGIHRVDGPDRFTVVADIGAFSISNPPETDFFVPSGVQYALQAYGGGFLVTDGHHNRVLRVSRDGQITVLRAFGNIVPTGLDVRGRTIHMAQAGPVPHLPEDGKVVAFRPGSPTVRDVAAGGRLLVDVELGRGHRLYALSQGDFPPGNPEGLARAAGHRRPGEGRPGRTFTVVVDRLNQPTSLELIGKTGYVITLGGEIWKINGVQGPPHPRLAPSNRHQRGPRPPGRGPPRDPCPPS